MKLWLCLLAAALAQTPEELSLRRDALLEAGEKEQALAVSQELLAMVDRQDRAAWREAAASHAVVLFQLGRTEEALEGPPRGPRGPGGGTPDRARVAGPAHRFGR